MILLITAAIIFIVQQHYRYYSSCTVVTVRSAITLGTLESSGRESLPVRVNTKGHHYPAVAVLTNSAFSTTTATTTTAQRLPWGRPTQCGDQLTVRTLCLSNNGDRNFRNGDSGLLCRN